MFCIHCGEPLPEDTQFCPTCGRPVESPSTPPSDFPDLEDLASQRVSTQPPPEFDPPARGPVNVQQAPEQPTIKEHIAPPPRYDDLDFDPPSAPEPERSNLIPAIIAAVLIVLAVIGALVKFHPWTLLAAGDSAFSAGSSQMNGPSSSAQSGVLPENELTFEWSDFNGAWKAGSAVFELLVEDGELNVTMQQGGKSYWDAAELIDDTDMVDVDLGGFEVRIKPRGSETLRIVIDGERFEAERYKGSLPEKEEKPVPETPNGEYLYYSPSTGTRSANGSLPDDDKLHFWPLDRFAISTADLDRLTQDEIDIIRNEAFARHGYVFTTEAWLDFFDAYTWYVPDRSFTEERFSKLEKQNIDTIVTYEREKGWM